MYHCNLERDESLPLRSLTAVRHGKEARFRRVYSDHPDFNYAFDPHEGWRKDHPGTKKEWYVDQLYLNFADFVKEAAEKGICLQIQAFYHDERGFSFRYLTITPETQAACPRLEDLYLAFCAAATAAARCGCGSTRRAARQERAARRQLRYEKASHA